MNLIQAFQMLCDLSDGAEFHICIKDGTIYVWEGQGDEIVAENIPELIEAIKELAVERRETNSRLELAHQEANEMLHQLNDR